MEWRIEDLYEISSFDKCQGEVSSSDERYNSWWRLNTEGDDERAVVSNVIESFSRYDTINLSNDWMNSPMWCLFVCISFQYLYPTLAIGDVRICECHTLINSVDRADCLYTSIIELWLWKVENNLTEFRPWRWTITGPWKSLKEPNRRTFTNQLRSNEKCECKFVIYLHRSNFNVEEDNLDRFFSSEGIEENWSESTIDPNSTSCSLEYHILKVATWQ